MALSSQADKFRIEKAAARLDRAFASIGRTGVVMLTINDHDLEFISADAAPLDVIERLAHEYMTTPSAIASEILKSQICNAAECEVIDA